MSLDKKLKKNIKRNIEVQISKEGLNENTFKNIMKKSGEKSIRDYALKLFKNYIEKKIPRSDQEIYFMKLNKAYKRYDK